MLVKLSVLIALSGAGVGAVALYRSQQPSTAPSVVPAAKQAAHASSAALRASALEAPAPAAVVELAPPEAPVVSMPDAVAETCHGKDCKNPGHPRATSAPAKRAAPDELARESALLTEARAALRAGDIPATQAALERLTRAFPRGVLTQEREVLAIELLLARDQNAEARARAARFVAEHPESPHSAKLERLLR
jgi:outer membrane biosynthesis protein TonB